MVAEIKQLVKGQTSGETAVPEKYLQAALTAYENARVDGLCHEGAWECVVETIQSLNRSISEAELPKETRYA